MSLFQLGIAVAKLKLDCVLREPRGKGQHKVVENTPKGFDALLTWIKKECREENPVLHVRMEATGIYWEAAGKPPELIIGARMRKLLHVAFGVIRKNVRGMLAFGLTWITVSTI